MTTPLSPSLILLPSTPVPNFSNLPPQREALVPERSRPRRQAELEQLMAQAKARGIRD